MLKVKLPITFDIGKEMYNAVLAMISRQSPMLSKMIHDDPQYNPFRLELPDKIISIAPELDGVLKQIDGLEIVNEMSHLDLLNKNYTNPAMLVDFYHTVFRIRGYDFPLPDPSMILNGLKGNWNRIFKEKISIPVPIPGEKSRKITHVQFVNIHSYHVAYSKEYPRATTFSGKVGLMAFRDPKYIQDFNVLMRFGEWCGVGSHRSMGLGKMTILAQEAKSDERWREGNLSSAVTSLGI